MNFSQALELLKGGKRIRREDWPDNYFISKYSSMNYLFVSSKGEADELEYMDVFDIMKDDWEEVKDDVK